MPFDESTKDELEGILAFMGSDAYDSDAKQRLAVIVSESDEARRIYLEHCQMHAMLHQSTLLSAFHAEKPQVVTTLDSTQWRRSYYAWAGLAVAVCAVFILGLTTAQFFGGDSGKGDPAPALRIAYVQEIEGIAWFGESRLTEGTKLMEGMEVSRGMVRVESGSMGLRFDNGTIVLVEGPAELSIESGMQVSLKRGRLAARVSEDAHGFTVLGPDSAVVDLGTEFAMAVEDGDSWVEVYDGEVDVALLNKEGQAWKSRELTASGPVRIDAANGQILDEAPPVALPRLAAVLPDGLDVPTAYVNAVLKRKPAHYWRFEEADDGHVADVVGEAAAVIHGATRLDNGGLFFPGKRQVDGLASHGLAFVAEPLPSLINNEFTLEAWLNPSFAQKRGLIGINHRSPDSESQEKLYQLQLLPAQHQTVFPGETIQFSGDLWPYGELGVVRVFSAAKYRPGAWHHVVAVRRDTQLEIYLNGEKAQTAPAPPLKSNPLPTTITIGKSSSPETENRRRDGRYFKGMVDEIAVYPSALSAEDVAEHYRLMQVE
jgi:hypothetical protein